MDRALRRHLESRARKRAYRIARWWFMLGTRIEDPPPAFVGRMASTHCRPCSCIFCKRPRYSDKPRVKAWASE